MRVYDYYDKYNILHHVVEYQSFEPCHHIRCLSHISHPCEICGRINASGIYKSDSIDYRDELEMQLEKL